MLKMISIGLVLILLGLAFFLYNVLHPPPVQFPEILQNLPSGFATREQTFNERLSKRFKLPIPTNQFLQTLRQQNFDVDETRRSAIFSSGGFLCWITWQINWSSVDEQIVAVTGKYHESCV